MEYWNDGRMDQHTSGDGHAFVPCLRPAWRDFAQAGEADYGVQARSRPRHFLYAGKVK